VRVSDNHFFNTYRPKQVKSSRRPNAIFAMADVTVSKSKEAQHIWAEHAEDLGHVANQEDHDHGPIYTILNQPKVFGW
jgi:hypothetical protein